MDDGGNVTGMVDMIADVSKSYPYLERQPNTQPMIAGMGGEPSNGLRQARQPPTRGVMEKKFPASRGR